MKQNWLLFLVLAAVLVVGFLLYDKLNKGVKVEHSIGSLFGSGARTS